MPPGSIDISNGEILEEKRATSRTKSNAKEANANKQSTSKQAQKSENKQKNICFDKNTNSVFKFTKKLFTS